MSRIIISQRLRKAQNSLLGFCLSVNLNSYPSSAHFMNGMQLTGASLRARSDLSCNLNLEISENLVEYSAYGRQ